MVDSGGLLSRCTGVHPVPRVRIPPSPPTSRRARVVAVVAVVLAGLLSTATGCVERYLRIDSDPAGARIHLNGRDVGTAPVEVPFTYYGTVRVDAWSPERPGTTQWVELVPPWYQRFPFELFAELFDPVTHVDRHEVTLTLPETAPTPSAAVRERAEQLRAESR